MRFTKSLKAIVFSAVMIAAGFMSADAVACGDNNVTAVEKIVQVNPTTVELHLSDNNKLTLDFYGETAVYPTFINEGNQGTLNGDVEIATITLKAKKNIKFNLNVIDGVIVDKHLNTVKF
ncbi:MAG: hypothetical protein J6U58_00625 [Bacteroidaceae bacterium]|nr:hypothetical protein [Bacteroidaceae bacterium]